ncbi:hypothetical protein LTR15_004056 [Elasticomyces elasticus]|nr:hypothetical protein LTR15_004056 [Elasticomyces elasticus]
MQSADARSGSDDTERHKMLPREPDLLDLARKIKAWFGDTSVPEIDPLDRFRFEQVPNAEYQSDRDKVLARYDESPGSVSSHDGEDFNNFNERYPAQARIYDVPAFPPDKDGLRAKIELPFADRCEQGCDVGAAMYHLPLVTMPIRHLDPIDTYTVEMPQDIYTPIRARQTRLLRLLPGSPDDALITELIVVDLLRTSGGFLPQQQAWVSYDAISYCWGDASASTTISCNGRPFPVTSNVRQALSRLRHRHTARYLWLDAVVINQQDFVERSAQVRNMLSIFKKASRVIVWLGEHTAHSDLVFRVLRSMSKEPGLPLRICRGHGDDLITGLEELTQHSWFRRVWVKQEVWAAENPIVMCADTVISWEDLTKAWDWIKELVPSRSGLASYRENLQAFVRPSIAERLRLTLRELPDPGGHSHADIITALTRTAYSHCTDPRDHVYGILGMTATNLTSSRTPHLSVNYHKSVSEVFQDVVRYVMARDQNLDVLLLNGTYGGLIAGSRLPSWCPDFSTARQRREWLEPMRNPDAAMICPTYQLPDSGMAVLRMEGIHIATLDFSAVLESSETNSISFDILLGELQRYPKPATSYPVSLSLPSGWIAFDLLVLGRSTGIPHVLRRRNDGMYSYIGSAYLYTAKGRKPHVLRLRNGQYTYVGATYSHRDGGDIFTRTEHMECLRDVSVGWSDWLLV